MPRVVVNPDQLMRDVDEMVREAQRHACKATNIVQSLREAKSQRTRDLQADALIGRLDALQAALGPAFLTRWRQDTLPPRSARRQEAPGAPDDLICKKCQKERPLTDFFYDDGFGSYGYTRRCKDCRGPGRKHGLEGPKP